MARNTLIIIFLSLLIIVFLLVPTTEKFVTLYGAKDNKPKGAPCEFDPECASNVCLAYNSKEGLQHTCA